MRDENAAKSYLNRRTLLRGGAVATTGLVALGAGASAQSDETDEPTVITERTTITEPGEYVLGDDLAVADETCLTIRASDVTLDGRGHEIVRTGDRALPDPDRPDPDTAGIGTDAPGSEPLSDITVTNVTVSNFGAGIHFDDVRDGSIGATTVRENNVGIYLENSTAITVAENTVDRTGWRGIALFDSDDNVVTENTSNNGDHDLTRGLELLNSNQNTIEKNIFSNNFTGVELGNSHGNGLEENNIRDNEHENVVLRESDTNALLENTVTGSGWVGISATGTGNEFKRNAVRDTRGYGFIVSGTENLVRGNEITGSAADGLNIDGERGRIEENTTSENDLAGIRVSGSECALNENVSTRNGEAELFLDEESSDTTGTGNFLSDDECPYFVDEGTNNDVKYTTE
ncbi:right-handed parallel beta-helix repeat-containing protein [Natrinema sp. DC36]|uniref:right-handed parallel beta-helix repeat-containing protein n=1 Tax=Natrinema sp. DC36 TaxID=2878680 RepID=UPI001CF040B3|nr:right-handed parallel beta-helix repeat-containing protein [Natrinema sp. DC36]